MSGTACRIKLNGRLDSKAAADPQNAFVIAVDIVKAFQIIVNPAIPFIRAVHVNLFNQQSKMLVFLNPLAGISRLPFVIGRRRHRQAAAGFPNRTKMVSRTAANSFILPFQMKLSQRFPLSSSSTFFAVHIPISADDFHVPVPPHAFQVLLPWNGEFEKFSALHVGLPGLLSRIYGTSAPTHRPADKRILFLLRFVHKAFRLLYILLRQQAAHRSQIFILS